MRTLGYVMVYCLGGLLVASRFVEALDADPMSPEHEDEQRQARTSMAVIADRLGVSVATVRAAVMLSIVLIWPAVVVALLATMLHERFAGGGSEVD